MPAMWVNENTNTAGTCTATARATLTLTGEVHVVKIFTATPAPRGPQVTS